MMQKLNLPEFTVPGSMKYEDMPDLLRHWYLGPPARRYMMLRRFLEVDGELTCTPGSRVLDIGSAWGFNVMALGRLGFDAYGVDIVVDQFPAGAEIAAHNDAVFRAAGADAAHLPFPDATFAGITMVETFEHIYLDDRPLALAECFRVLAPGGCIVMSTPNYASFVESVKRFTGNHRWIRDRLPTMCYPDEGTARDAYHPYQYHHPLPDRRILSLLGDAGFQPHRVKHFLFMLKNTSDAMFGATRAAEAVAERLPGVRRLAATSCFVAVKPR